MADDLDPAVAERAARGLFLHEYPGSEGAWGAPGDFDKTAVRASWSSTMCTAVDDTRRLLGTWRLTKGSAA